MSDALALPDVLVCGAGGTLGEAWMRGLLDGASAGGGPDFRECAHFVGTSAGSIVSAVLASGHRPDAGAEATKAWSDDAAAAAADDDGPRPRLLGAARYLGRLGAAAMAPAAPLALAAVAPGGAAVRAAALRAVPRRGQPLDRLGRLMDRFAPSFDGRLRIAAVDRASGRRVIFGAPGSPDATVRDAVLASCAVPGVFPAVRIGGLEYVDGGVWSFTNLDVAPVTRGARVLCLVPTAAGPFRAPTAALLSAETLAVKARGAEVRVLRPDARSIAAIGPNLMDPRRRDAVLAAGYAQGRAAARRDRGAAAAGGARRRG
jgi:NTE family protein